MASIVYDHALYLLEKKSIDFSADTFKIRLVMTNTTCDTERNKATMSGFTTIDAYDGANYADKTLASETVTEDNINHRGVFDAADFTWTALGVGTRQAQGMVLYKFVTNDSDSIPIAFIDTGGFPFDGNGGDVTVTVNASGLMYTTN